MDRFSSRISVFYGLQYKREDEEIPLPPQDVVQPGSVRCMVYNIRHGAGLDNIVDMSRILKVIKESGATIVALN